MLAWTCRSAGHLRAPANAEIQTMQTALPTFGINIIHEFNSYLCRPTIDMLQMDIVTEVPCVNPDT
jgi:hypothetical protein